MKTMNILCTLLCTMLLTALPATAQNTNDDKNKAIIESKDGNRELNTDDIQVIRFNGGKVTVVHSEGETTFDRTLRSLSFQRPNPGTLRLTATTSIGTEGSGNRAQTIDGGKLKATWAEGDVVYVYADANTTENIGTLTPKTYGDKTATLTGNITATNLSEGQTLYFSTQPRPFNFSSQDGTTESLFYFTATAPVTINGGNASVSDLSFTRPFAVVKFTLKDKGNSDAAISAKSFTVHDGTKTYTVTPTTATNELFVGIPAITSQTVTLTATDGLSSYSYERASVTFEDNKYYAINVKMTNTTDYLTVPLTFEAKEDGATVTFTEGPNVSISPLEYSTDGTTWSTYTSGTPITLTNAGDKVSFRGDNATYAAGSSDNCTFSCSDDCYIYGNIMSLINKDNFATNTTLTGSNTFTGLFAKNDYLYNHADKTLLLPATTLTVNCYQDMFQGCTSLTTAPALPATTLTENCYNGMFHGCTSLTKAPVLPATTLATGCYYIMFQGCTKLNNVTCLATDILAEGCTTNWLDGVAATGMFYKAPDANWTTGASGIPSGWTVPTLSVTASDYSGTYDGTAHGITVTCDGATIKYRTTDSGEYDLTENPTYSAVGTYTVYYQVTRDYYVTVTGSRTVTISKAMLTATAADASRGYGSSNPTFTVNVTGFVNGETAATAAGYTAPTASTVATSSSNVGDYIITPSGGTATNYDFTYVDGTLTINKVAATLSLNNTTAVSFTANQTIDATNTSHTATYSGGTLTASSSDASKASVSVNTSTGVITVTRKTDAAFSNVTITVSVTPDGNHTAPSNQTFTVSAAFHDTGVALANASVGYKVCSNGKAYATNAAWPSGESVIGMVAYKNGSNGIVLYKQDNPSTYTYENRNSGNPSAANVYVSDLTSKTGKSWTCGTASQYQNCGVTPSGWSTLQDLLSSAGCTQFTSGQYWSLTQYFKLSFYYFSNGTWGYMDHSSYLKVRPLFEF